MANIWKRKRQKQIKTKKKKAEKKKIKAEKENKIEPRWMKQKNRNVNVNGTFRKRKRIFSSLKVGFLYILQMCREHAELNKLVTPCALSVLWWKVSHPFINSLCFETTRRVLKIMEHEREKSRKCCFALGKIGSDLVIGTFKRYHV